DGQFAKGHFAPLASTRVHVLRIGYGATNRPVGRNRRSAKGRPAPAGTAATNPVLWPHAADAEWVTEQAKHSGEPIAKWHLGHLRPQLLIDPACKRLLILTNVIAFPLWGCTAFVRALTPTRDIFSPPIWNTP